MLKMIGAEQLNAKIAKHTADMVVRQKRAVDEVAKMVADDEKRLVRKDSRKLANSVTIHPPEGKGAGYSRRVEAGAGCESGIPGKSYAIPQEFGTSKMTPGPFVGPAARNNKGQLGKKMRRK